MNSNLIKQTQFFLMCPQWVAHTSSFIITRMQLIAHMINYKSSRNSVHFFGGTDTNNCVTNAL